MLAGDADQNWKVVMSLSEFPDETEPEASGQLMPKDETTLTGSLMLFVLGVVAGFVFIYSVGDWLF